MNARANTVTIVILSLSLWCGPARVADAQVLETETARFVPAGALDLNSAFEFQTSSEGTESALPFAAEWGVTNKLSLLLEPVAYTAIHPKVGAHATGAGDVEATALALLRTEGRTMPALAVAGEVKFPTSKNTLIGTGETDYTGYLIASKRIGRVDAHANLSYTILGQPPGASLSNLVGGALAAEYFVSDRVEFFGEALGNTSSSSEAGDNPGSAGAAVPEAAGGELVGTLGMGVRPSRDFLVSLGVSYDNNQAFLVRPGVTIRF